MWGSERRTNQYPSLDTSPTSAPYKKPLESRTYLASWVGLSGGSGGGVFNNFMPATKSIRMSQSNVTFFMAFANQQYPIPTTSSYSSYTSWTVNLFMAPFFLISAIGPINITIIIVRPWRKLTKLSFGPPPISNSHSKTIFLLWILYISNIGTGLYHQQSREGHLPIHEKQQRQKWRNQSMAFLFHGNIERRRRS